MELMLVTDETLQNKEDPLTLSEGKLIQSEGEETLGGCGFQCAVSCVLYESVQV